jgi:hypothetical protein
MLDFDAGDSPGPRKRPSSSAGAPPPKRHQKFHNAFSSSQATGTSARPRNESSSAAIALAGMQNPQAPSPTGNNFEDILSAISASATAEQAAGNHFTADWSSANLFELEHLGVVTSPIPQQQHQHSESPTASASRTPAGRSTNKSRSSVRPSNGGTMLENIGRVALEKRKSNTRTRLIERSAEPDWVHHPTPEVEKLRKRAADTLVWESRAWAGHVLTRVSRLQQDIRTDSSRRRTPASRV